MTWQHYCSNQGGKTIKDITMTICIYLYLSIVNGCPWSPAPHFPCCLESTKPDITSSLVEIFPPPSLSKWSKTAFQAAALAEVAERFGCNALSCKSTTKSYPAFNASFASWGSTGGGLTWYLSPDPLCTAQLRWQWEHHARSINSAIFNF